MSFHVVVLSRQEVAAGALGFQDRLSSVLTRRMIELNQQLATLRASGYTGRLNAPRQLVEILSLNPFPFDQYVAARDRFGGDAFMVLFFNDVAHEVCEIYGIELNYSSELSDDELPANVGVFLRMEYYGDLTF
jgi:hypothetical protein